MTWAEAIKAILLNKRRRQATAATVAIFGVACLAYGVAVKVMSGKPEGDATVLACCIPPALIFFIMAYVIYKEGGD